MNISKVLVLFVAMVLQSLIGTGQDWNIVLPVLLMVGDCLQIYRQALCDWENYQYQILEGGKVGEQSLKM